MTSYAPLLNNPRFTEWQPDLITFNNHQCYGIPSYYMLKMFAENRGNYVCDCDVETGYSSRHDKGSTCLLTDGDKKAIDSTETNTGVVSIMILISLSVNCISRFLTTDLQTKIRTAMN